MESHINLSDIKLKHVRNKMVKHSIHALRQIQKKEINIMQIILNMRRKAMIVTIKFVLLDIAKMVTKDV